MCGGKCLHTDEENGLESRRRCQHVGERMKKGGENGR